MLRLLTAEMADRIAEAAPERASAAALPPAATELPQFVPPVWMAVALAETFDEKVLPALISWLAAFVTDETNFCPDTVML